jgi:BirA family biotin operon repressor/biotin-[acetyl-CoA-carboxylase] ligase
MRAALADLPLPSIKYYETIDSTNNEALAWVEHGAAEYSLVFADNQTAGRGRLNRRWVTHSGSALSFSVILHPSPDEAPLLPLFSPLGALAVASALTGDFGASGVEVKWPNDVLIHRRKVCGVLAETVWLGDRPQSIIIGIGINITPRSIPPSNEVIFPAACVESALGGSINRFGFLASVLRSLINWRNQLGSVTFCKAWEHQLAFKGEVVRVEEEGQPPVVGYLLGIAPNGHLQLKTQDDKFLDVAFGDVHLRPAES